MLRRHCGTAKPPCQHSQGSTCQQRESVMPLLCCSVMSGYTWDGVIHKMSDKQWGAMLDVHVSGGWDKACAMWCQLLGIDFLPIMVLTEQLQQVCARVRWGGGFYAHAAS